MTSDANTLRLETLEKAVGQLTDRVGEVVKYMERLVVIEERNSFMAEQHRELKQTLKESIDAMSTKHSELDKKVGELQEKMIRMMTVFSCVTGVAAVAAPYIFKAMAGG